MTLTLNFVLLYKNFNLDCYLVIVAIRQTFCPLTTLIDL